MNQYEKCDNCPYPNRSECVGKNIKKCNVSKEELIEQIEYALEELYNKDYYLICNEVNEMCIAAHFWRYFFNEFHMKYVGLDMDTEYNRNGTWAKYYEITEAQRRRYAKPDMIIHKRGCNYHNFVCIEFKGYWNNRNVEDENDFVKLKAFTKPELLLTYGDKKYSYRYRYGIRLKFDRNSVEFKWFENGRYIQECDFTWKKE